MADERAVQLSLILPMAASNHKVLDGPGRKREETAMKAAIITFTVLVALATPSLATDSLHLLATVATTKANDATNESTTKIKDTKMEAQLNSRSVNPIVISRDRALNQ